MKSGNSAIVCPFCQSDNVSAKKQFGLLAMLAYLLLGIFLPFYKKTMHCFDCDKEWKN